MRGIVIPAAQVIAAGTIALGGSTGLIAKAHTR